MRVSSFPSFVRGDTVTMEFKTGLDLAHVSSAVLVIEQCGYTITKEGDALEVSGGSVRGTLTPSESMTLIPGRVSVQLSLRFEDGTVFSSDPETWMVENRVGGSTGSSTVLADAEFSAYVGIPVPAPHPDLEGRDLPDQHPITAVTGLEDALASKADGVATAQALATKADADATAKAIEGRVGRDEFSRAMDGKADTAALTGEAMQRVEGDTALRMLISDEVRDRRDAVASEASARDAAVSSLSIRIDRKQDRLTAGKNVTIIDGVISAAGTEYGQATTTAPGLMSASDKAKLDTVARGAEPNVIESVRVNGSPLTVTSDGAVNVDLTGYATKADLSTIPKWDKVVVDKLPTTGIQLDKIYLVPNSGSGTNSRDEYIYVDGKWELIGTTETDISGKQDVITGAASTVTSADLTAGRVLVSDSSGKIAVDSLVTVSELRFLDGVKSNVQTQMDAEATARADADTDIRRAVTEEASARDAAVKAEATARADAVGTLQRNIDGKVSKAGDTMTGNLVMSKKDPRMIILNTAVAIEDYVSDNQFLGVYYMQDKNNKNVVQLGSRMIANGIRRLNISQMGADGVTTAQLSAVVDSNNVAYAIAPTYPIASDNSDKIATTAWVNTASSVVHTTGIETINGAKIFTSNPIIEGTWPSISMKDKDYMKGSLPSSDHKVAWLKPVDSNGAELGGYELIGDTKGNVYNRLISQTLKSDGTEVKAFLYLYANRDGTSYATAPATRTTGYGTTDIVTAGWADAKFVKIAGDTLTGDLFITGTASRWIRIRRTDLDRSVEQTFPTSGTTYTGGLGLFDKTNNTLISFNRSVVPTGVVATLQNSQFVNGAQRNSNINLIISPTGETYTTTVTATNPASNNTTIATTAWVNTASSVVHTTSNEIVAGTKTFTHDIMSRKSIRMGPIETTAYRDIEFLDGTKRLSFIRAENYESANSLRFRVDKLGGSGNWSDMGGLAILGLADRIKVTSMIPPISGYDVNEIATAGWVDNKIASQKAETWTFTLDDGSTVTKEVLVR